MPSRSLVLVFVLLASSASAQIATDRPGFGFSPLVVDRGTVQVEAGLPQASRLNFVSLDVGIGGSATTYSFPVLLRYGVTDAVEIRLGSSVYDVIDVSVAPPNTDFGSSNGNPGLDVIEVGAKIQLATNGPIIALLPSVLIPTTEANDIGAAVRAIAGWSLSPTVGLTTILGATYANGEPDAIIVGEAVAVLGTSLTDALSVYAELAAFTSENATPVFGGGGLTFLVTPDVQLDASFDLGLTDEAENLLLGAGASIRF
ncbi:MAG: transporter [Bacteroidota bacterium]